MSFLLGTFREVLLDYSAINYWFAFFAMVKINKNSRRGVALQFSLLLSYLCTCGTAVMALYNTCQSCFYTLIFFAVWQSDSDACSIKLQRHHWRPKFKGLYWLGMVREGSLCAKSMGEQWNQGGLKIWGNKLQYNCGKSMTAIHSAL